MTTGQLYWMIFGTGYIALIATYIGLREFGFWMQRRRIRNIGRDAERYLRRLEVRR